MEKEITTKKLEVLYSNWKSLHGYMIFEIYVYVGKTIVIDVHTDRKSNEHNKRQLDQI